MQTQEDIKALTYDVSHTVSEKDEYEIDEERYEKQEEEEEKEDDKEETDKQDEDLQGEGEGKDIGEKGNGKEGVKDKEEPPRVSPEHTEREATTALTSLNTPIKQKGKRQRQTPLYFRTRKSTRIRQGKPQTPTKIPIVIEDSPKQQEKMPPPMKKKERRSSAQISPESPITYVKMPVTRSTSSKGKEILRDTQQDLHEVEAVLRETLLNLQET